MASEASEQEIVEMRKVCRGGLRMVSEVRGCRVQMASTDGTPQPQGVSEVWGCRVQMAYAMQFQGDDIRFCAIHGYCVQVRYAGEACICRGIDSVPTRRAQVGYAGRLAYGE